MTPAWAMEAMRKGRRAGKSTKSGLNIGENSEDQIHHYPSALPTNYLQWRAMPGFIPVAAQRTDVPRAPPRSHTHNDLVEFARQRYRLEQFPGRRMNHESP